LLTKKAKTRAGAFAQAHALLEFKCEIVSEQIAQAEG
jgi:hypothetical protein